MTSLINHGNAARAPRALILATYTLVVIKTCMYTLASVHVDLLCKCARFASYDKTEVTSNGFGIQVDTFAWHTFPDSVHISRLKQIHITQCNFTLDQTTHRPITSMHCPVISKLDLMANKSL